MKGEQQMRGEGGAADEGRGEQQMRGKGEQQMRGEGGAADEGEGEQQMRGRKQQMRGEGCSR